MSDKHKERDGNENETGAIDEEVGVGCGHQGRML
jgi:hypothetical protein